MPSDALVGIDNLSTGLANLSTVWHNGLTLTSSGEECAFLVPIYFSLELR